MKKMKLTKKNKKELKMICGVLIFFAVIFIWIVQNIGSADQDTSRKRPDQGDRHIIL